MAGRADPDRGEAAWASDPTIAAHLDGCQFTFLTMREMWSELQDKLKKTPAPSEIGRLAQQLKAAGIDA